MPCPGFSAASGSVCPSFGVVWRRCVRLVSGSLCHPFLGCCCQQSPVGGFLPFLAMGGRFPAPGATAGYSGHSQAVGTDRLRLFCATPGLWRVPSSAPSCHPSVLWGFSDKSHWPAAPCLRELTFQPGAHSCHAPVLPALRCFANLFLSCPSWPGHNFIVPPGVLAAWAPLRLGFGRVFCSSRFHVGQTPLNHSAVCHAAFGDFIIPGS